MKEYPITLDVTSVTPQGFGVGRDENGRVVFVPNTAVGDRAVVGVIKELKSCSYARLKEIIAPSPSRIGPDCEVCFRCGGCVFRHIDYPAELELKRKFVSDAFKRIAGTELDVGEVICGDPLFYRNKVQYPFAGGENGKTVFGYYAPRSHRITRHEKCFLQDEKFDLVAAFCAETADEYGIKPYDEKTGEGTLRHIVMRKNRGGDMLVCLVTKGAPNGKTMALAKKIYENFDFVVGVHINQNDRADNVILGKKTSCIAGSETLRDTLCGKSFSLSPESFYQVNADMAERLYEYASSLAPGGERNVILDMYCGAGTVGLCTAGENDLLFGVEIVESAVKNAFENAILNGRSEENTRFVCGDAEIGVRECQKRFGTPNVIIVDPPRKGLERGVIDTIVRASPERVIYISCDPATLARDCKAFAESGYFTDFAQPFDLFPRTGHVETVCLLCRQ